jgi:hypothetical protein
VEEAEMATTRIAKPLAISLALLIVGHTLAMAGPQLLLHWDRETGSSKAVVRNSTTDVLAEFPWAGALPRRYSLEQEEEEAPTFLLAKLRDQLEQSSQPGAEVALAFIRDLLGPYADTPVEELPLSLETWIPHASTIIEEWCGMTVNAVGECTEPANPSSLNPFCTNFACKRTMIAPQE